MVGVVRVEHCSDAVLPGFGGGRVDWVGGLGGGTQRVRPNRETPAHLVGHGFWGFSLGHAFGRD